MHHSNNKRHQSEESKKELEKANERRLEALTDINDKYMRTQRHLEQHADIGDPENIKHAMEIQNVRQIEMDNLKNIIAYDKHQVDDADNLKKNFEYTEGYLAHNSNQMDEQSFKNTKRKQERRKRQMGYPQY